MKRNKSICAIVAGLLCTLCAEAQTIELSDGWECQSSAVVGNDGASLSKGSGSSASWYAAHVPSTVMGVLVANGEYPKILERDNYKKYDNGRFLVPWFFKKSFRLDGLKEHEHVRLLFEGLNYSANIYLNGKLVASRDTVVGPFSTFAFDVTAMAKEENTLVVETFRCKPGDYNIGFVDWNPRPLDESMGIVRPVKVQRCGDVVIESPRVCSRVDLNTLVEAWLDVEAQLRNLSDHDVSGQLVCSFEGQEYALPVRLHARQVRTVRLDENELAALHVVNPRLWWCYTMGSPEMYSLSLAFVADQVQTDMKEVRFGIREVGSYFTKEGHRAFSLNGRRIQILGAGWTDDIFLRDDAERYDRQLELVKQMNLNTVRLEGFWGTSQALYDLCDEKGILLFAGWSCFWEWESYLGKPCNDTYGGVLTSEDARLIAREYDDQLRYLRNHPSIIAWFVGSDKLPIPQLEYHYEWARKTIDNRPYITSAKQLESTISGTSGTKMAGPYEYVAPAYWYSEEAPGGAFGFNTETGIGAQLPVKESLQQMLGNSLWPLDSVADYLCTSATEAFNSLKVLKETVEKRYGKADNIDDFLRKANMVNYEGTKAMFEAFRYNSPKATALIHWMLNAARPSLYWQLYDHFLRPNAAFYGVRKACQPIQLVYNHLTRDVRAVNGTLAPVTITASMKVYGLSGTVLGNKEVTLTVPAMASAKAFDPIELSVVNGRSSESRQARLDGRVVTDEDEVNGYLFLCCQADGHTVSENEYALTTAEDVFDWSKSEWIGTPMLKHADMTGIGSQQPAKCKARVKEIQGRMVDLVISNPSDKVAYMLRIVLKDKKGRHIDGVTFSDNYISIEPNGEKTVTCLLPGDMKFTVDVLPY